MCACMCSCSFPSAMSLWTWKPNCQDTNLPLVVYGMTWFTVVPTLSLFYQLVPLLYVVIVDVRVHSHCRFIANNSLGATAVPLDIKVRVCNCSDLGRCDFDNPLGGYNKTDLFQLVHCDCQREYRGKCVYSYFGNPLGGYNKTDLFQLVHCDCQREYRGKCVYSYFDNPLGGYNKTDLFQLVHCDCQREYRGKCVYSYFIA